jgi:hypothetical protein
MLVIEKRINIYLYLVDIYFLKFFPSFVPKEKKKTHCLLPCFIGYFFFLNCDLPKCFHALIFQSIIVGIYVHVIHIN